MILRCFEFRFQGLGLGPMLWLRVEGFIGFNYVGFRVEGSRA